MYTKPSIILVSPQGDGNIGAVARAMKNFGFSDLRLINPVPYFTDHAFAWAVNAKDILQNAKVFRSLIEATEDISTTFALTRRLGRMRQTSILLDEATSIIASRSNTSPAGLIFGREDAGLTNEEVKFADFVVTIPTSSNQPSLNLAQAVLIACYKISQPEMMEKLSNTPALNNPPMEFVDHSERARTLAGIERALTGLGYWDSIDNPLKSKILSQLGTMFGRAGLTRGDVGMFDGLTARIIEKTYGNHKK